MSNSQSVTRPKPSDEDEEKKEMAEAAFREWLKRKAAEPHTPRASPSRYDTISNFFTRECETINFHLFQRTDQSPSERRCTAPRLQQLVA
ncbi:unnamed protein product [Nippostrongylus brasiliensis]|uniref:DFRP_C domain-containing protein n=1 Tax=Nippostrongylus brasiliensis TaxID=27835 RepID=A0A0N4XPN5_NIPBR|nr:unnamed protein product [Nippostrongylus brasiliensis]